MPSQLLAEWVWTHSPRNLKHQNKYNLCQLHKCVLVSIHEKNTWDMHVYILTPRTTFPILSRWLVRDKEVLVVSHKDGPQNTVGRSESRGSCSSAKGSCGCFFLSKSQNSSSTGGSLSPDRCSVLIPKKTSVGQGCQGGHRQTNRCALLRSHLQDFKPHQWRGCILTTFQRFLRWYMARDLQWTAQNRLCCTSPYNLPRQIFFYSSWLSSWFIKQFGWLQFCINNYKLETPAGYGNENLNKCHGDLTFATWDRECPSTVHSWRSGECFQCCKGIFGDGWAACAIAKRLRFDLWNLIPHLQT